MYSSGDNPARYLAHALGLNGRGRESNYVHKLKPHSLEWGRGLLVLILDHPKNKCQSNHTLWCVVAHCFFDLRSPLSFVVGAENYNSIDELVKEK